MAPFEEVVTRWVEHPGRPVESVLARAAAATMTAPGAFCLDTPFERSPRHLTPAWTARARLVARGRALSRGDRIEVEVIAWPDDTAEVNIRPAGRRVLSWSPMHERRYFDLANEAANAIASAFAAARAA